MRGAIEERFGGLVDSITLEFGASSNLSENRDLILDIQQIESEFQDFSTRS